MKKESFKPKYEEIGNLNIRENSELDKLPKQEKLKPTKREKGGDKAIRDIIKRRNEPNHFLRNMKE